MKIPQLLAASLAVAAVAAQTAWAKTLNVKTAPSCALPCLYQMVTIAHCPSDDIQCMCKDRWLQERVKECLQEKCGIADGLRVSKMQADACAWPVESKQTLITAATAVWFSLATLFIITRLCTRYFIVRQMAFDDWTILGAQVAIVPFAGLTLAMARHGAGRHIWDIDIDYMELLYHTYYVSETLYIITLCLVKVSILAFYYRKFPIPRFQLVAKITLIFVVITHVGMALIQIFQCVPIEYNWNKDIKDPKCLPYNTIAFGFGIINVIQDFIILLLPLPIVWELQVKARRKLILYGLFIFGLWASTTSIIRLIYLGSFGSINADTTWDDVGAIIWSDIEVYTIIICACLPTLRPFIIFLAKKLGYTPRHPSESLSFLSQPSNFPPPKRRMTFREVKRQRTISSTFKSVEAQTDEESGPGNPKVFDIWTGPDVEDWKRSELNAAERNPSKSTSEGSNEIPLADVV